jgi:signal peptidase II
MNRLKRAFLILGLIALVLGIDRVAKVVAIETLAGLPPRDFLGGTIRLVYQENHGAMLSLGANLPESIRFLFFGALVALVLVVLLVIVLIRARLSGADAVSASLVIGGGLGNVIDRFLFDGAVIDFLNIGVGSIRTGVFNLADVVILLGIVLFVVSRKHGSSSGDTASVRDHPDDTGNAKEGPDGQGQT